MLWRLIPLVAAGALLGACSTSEGGGRAATPAQDATAEGPARLGIVAGGVELTATLRDTAAARDLVALLPLSVAMRDHGGVEKTGRLPGPLSMADDPSGADPDPRDLGYYAPGDSLVLYYGDQSYFEGIVVLGRLEGDVDALAGLTGTVTVEVRRLPS